MYASLIHKLETYLNVIRIRSKGYFPISFLPPLKLDDI